MSYLENFKIQEVHYDYLFRYNKDLAVIGHLTESLVPRDMLTKLRQETATELTDEYMYKNLEVRVMQIAGVLVYSSKTNRRIVHWMAVVYGSVF